MSPRYFLTKYAWIQNRNTGEIIKWQPWPYLLDILTIYETFNDIICIKARQLGLSWTDSGYGLHQVMFKDAAKVVFFSQGEKEAWEMLAKSRFIMSRLPDFLCLQADSSTRGVLTFTSNESKLEALPSTEKAGRGTDATVIFRDELAQHPYGKENLASVGPAIDGGGKLIDVSTIFKLDSENHFTDRVRRALRGATLKSLSSGIQLYQGGESGAVLLFLGYKLRPVREEGLSLEEWFESKIKRRYTAFQIEQEYPATIEQALSVPQTLAFFDQSRLGVMENDCQYEPLQVDKDKLDTHEGVIKVYKLPQVGQKYCLFSDPSDGFDDPHAIVVADVQTGEEVAHSHGKTSIEECAQIHDSLVRYYNNAWNSFDALGGSGGSFMVLLQKLETPNMAVRRRMDGSEVEGKIGIYANTHAHIKLLLDALGEAIKTGAIRVHTLAAVKEMQNMIRVQDNHDHKGKNIEMAQVVKGMHDDWISAWRGIVYLRAHRPPSAGRIVSSDYKMRW